MNSLEVGRRQSNMYVKMIFLIIYYILVNIHAEQTGICPTGLFGPACRYLCHCRDVCLPKGDCFGGICEYHWFGPSCQYVDIASWGVASHVPGYIADFNDETCNPISDATSVEVTLTRPGPLTFFRIVVNDATNAMNFITSFNTEESCWNERKFRVSNTTVDVTCDTRVLLETLRLDGLVSPSVCTIYVSIGRFLSNKQQAMKSSNYENNPSLNPASYAVDTDPSTCTSTNIESAGPEITIILNKPARLVMMNIRGDGAGSTRFLGTRLFLYDDDDKLDSVILMNSSSPFDGVTMYSNTAIRRLVFKQSVLVPLLQRYLTLCDVSIYGDPVCPDKAYGLDCEKTCACNESEVCNFMTGLCAPGCQPGMYGFNCSSHCSPHCVSERCHYFSGSCSPCRYGYFGDTCEDMCLPGTFGLIAPCKNCSIGCDNTCNTSTGYCRCKDKYIGEFCDQCISGRFGPELSCPNCSKGCANICNTTNGHCTCLKDYIGSQCTECRPGTFGSECQYICGIGCNATCNSIDGHCSCKENFDGFLCAECRVGTFGPYCNSTCSDGCAKSCDNTDGNCTCKTGFGGPLCIECMPGLFGATCKSLCAKGCKEICSKKTGRCACKKNYIGTLCKDCRPGTFGSDCKLNCSRGCDKKCDHTNGSCSCRKGFQGSHCIECVHPRYGRRCDLTCSKRCRNQVCAQMTGKCLACIDGHEGEDCVQTSGLMALGWKSPFPFFILLILLFFALGIYKKDEDEEEPEILSNVRNNE